jgi:hypothetical protein
MRRFVLRMRKMFRFEEIDQRGCLDLIVREDAVAGRGEPRPYNGPPLSET